MRAVKAVSTFAVIAGLTLVVSAIVSFFYALTAHGEGAVDWALSIRLALILGLVLSIVEGWEHT